MIERWVVQASTYAADIDGVIPLIGVLVGFWFLVAEGVFFYLIFKFRAKDGQRAVLCDQQGRKLLRSTPE